MTTQKESQLVLTFSEGITEGVAEDVAEGIVTRSENTRLTTLKGSLTKCPGTEPIWSSEGTDVICGGLVAGPRDSIAAYFKPEIGHRRIANEAVEEPLSPVTGTAQQNAYFPYPMIDSGGLHGSYLNHTPAVCFDSAGRQWFANVRLVGGTSLGIFVNVIRDGVETVVPRQVTTINTTIDISYANTLMWCGITQCSLGVVLWYAHEVLGICARKLSLGSDGTQLFIGTEKPLYVPLATNNYHLADVVSDGANAAWIICRDDTVGTTMRIIKVDTTTIYVSGNLALPPTFVSGVAPRCSISTYFDGVTRYVFWAVQQQTSSFLKFGSINGAAMTSNWSDTAAFNGNVAQDRSATAIQPHVVKGVWSVVVAVTELNATTAATAFHSRSMATGAATGQTQASHYILQSRGCNHRVSAAEVYPYFSLIPAWSSASGLAIPTETGQTPTDYVVDPSIEVVTVFDPTLLTPVARFGVDRVNPDSKPFCSNAVAVSSDGRICFAYAGLRIDQSRETDSAWPTWYVVLDLNPTSQPRCAYDHGNVAAIASSLVATWDGTETTEYGVFHRPRVTALATGGTGPALTGAYYFSAVITWRDAAGNVRRSAPSLPFPLTLATTAPLVRVSTPLTMRSGTRQEDYDITVYATAAGGASFWRLAAVPTSKAANGSIWTFGFIPTPTASGLPLYSDGSTNAQFTPEAPPPAWDARTIAGRMWLIDAEDRNRVLPSLLKQAGIAYEFNSTLAVTGFDEQYGKLMAVVDVGGQPMFLAERGIWSVSGYGPDNAGQGQPFSDPRLVYNLGCRSLESVVQVPGVGVMFQANDGRFTLLTTGGGIKRFDTFGIYDVATPTIHLNENEVVYPLQDGTGFVAYNYIADGWTYWPSDSFIPTASCATTSQAGTLTYYFDSVTSGIAVLDSSSTAANAPMVFERGWIAPEGSNADCNMREVWFQARRVGVHGVTIRASLNYDESSFIERTWSEAEITSLAPIDGQYTIALKVQDQQARALKVRVTEDIPAEGDGNGMQPMKLTVYYGASPGARRRTLSAVAMK